VQPASMRSSGGCGSWRTGPNGSSAPLITRPGDPPSEQDRLQQDRPRDVPTHDGPAGRGQARGGGGGTALPGPAPAPAPRRQRWKHTRAEESGREGHRALCPTLALAATPKPSLYLIRGRRRRRVLDGADVPTGPPVIPPCSGHEGAAGRERTTRHEPGQHGHRGQCCRQRRPWASGPSVLDDSVEHRREGGWGRRLRVSASPGPSAGRWAGPSAAGEWGGS